MHSRRFLRTILLAAALVAPAACSSSTAGTSATSAPTTSAADTTAPTTSEATGTTTGSSDDATTTTKANATPTTKPAATGAQITMSVTNPPSCPSPDVTFQAELTVTISWTVTNADSVTIAIDGPGAFESGLPLSGSMVRPWSCPASEHTYTVQAVKNGQMVAQKSKTVNPST